MTLDPPDRSHPPTPGRRRLRGRCSHPIHLSRLPRRCPARGPDPGTLKPPPGPAKRNIASPDPPNVSLGGPAHACPDGRPRFASLDDPQEVTDEIALNPTHFADRTQTQTLSTLVHEMVHLWQHHFGTPSRAGYHNKEWAAEMREIGLIPSDTGQPGGKDVGQKVSHYIDGGGLFARSCAAYLADGAAFLYHDRAGDAAGVRKKKAASKTRYTCPDCGLNAWAKPAIRLLCGDCNEPMRAAATDGSAPGSPIQRLQPEPGDQAVIRVRFGVERVLLDDRVFQMGADAVVQRFQIPPFEQDQAIDEHQPQPAIVERKADLLQIGIFDREPFAVVEGPIALQRHEGDLMPLAAPE